MTNMKDNRSILIFLLFVTVLLPSCKKWPIDYRNKWTGNYSFKSTKLYWDGYAWITQNKNTDGKVFYRPFQNIGKSITIEIFDVTSFTVDVDKAGTIKNAENPEVGGHIATSNLSFTAIVEGKPSDFYTVTATRQ